MANALKLLREQTRQSATGDSLYYRRLLNFFELRVPPESAFGVINEFLFPFVIPHDSMRVEEPFTVEVTPTQGGGLYTEENGIVQRMITIRGNTGFKPRRLQGNGSWVLATTTPEKKSYTRQLPSHVTDAITGHRHFEYLNDAVFRTYGDLKRDPATAEGTKLILHVPKDEEHWVVVPQRFTLERAAGRPHIYNYAIDLIAVDKADDVEATFSEDKDWLDTLRDGVRVVKAAVDLASGAIQDLTAIVGELENFIKDVAKIIDAVGTILEAAQDFLDGVTDLIQAPLALIDSTLGLIDTAQDTWDALKEANEDIRDIDDTIKHKLFQVTLDALELFGTHPELFETPQQREARQRKERSILLRDISPARRTEAEASDPPSSIDAWAALGTALTPGDVLSAQGELFSAVRVPNYSSAQLVPIGQGDTLPNLAARYLGDARRWDDIADQNNLEPPFVDAQASTDLQTTDDKALSQALGTGDYLLIPNFTKSAAKRALTSVLGVRPTESPLVHLLGRDLAVVRTTSVGETPVSYIAPRRPLFDLPVDIAGGSQDAQTAEGIDNLSQGLLLRITTERGTDILYRRLGLGRVVGTNQAGIELEISRFRVTECLGADARVASVRQVIFEGIDPGSSVAANVSLDTLVVDVEIEVLGFAERVNVRLAV